MKILGFRCGPLIMACCAKFSNPRWSENVRFLANFMSEAGIVIKRSQTGISAKAQRKVAREIKTARAFGLMPFATMGTKSFAFGKIMENLDEDFEYYRNVEGEDIQGTEDPLDAWNSHFQAFCRMFVSRKTLTNTLG